MSDKVTSFAREKAAQAWQKEKTINKVMDPDLAEAFAEIIEEISSKPWLGNATTGELIEELKARSDLDYRTVD
jgi:tellurite resistance protein